MSTNFPAALDSLVNPVGTDSVATVDHAAQHTNANDAIEALQVRVGITGSTDPASLTYRLDALESNGHVIATVDPVTEAVEIVAGITRIPLSGPSNVLRRMHNCGLSDVPFLFVSDSTGDAADEFVKMFVINHLAPAFPLARIEYSLFNTSTGTYPNKELIGGSDAEPYVTVATPGGHGWGMEPSAVESEGAELDVWVEAELEDWGSDAKAQSLIARWGTAGKYSWKLSSTFGGTLKLEWSTDGTTISSALCSVTYGMSAIPNNARRLIRATLKCDNGAGGYEVKFYQSSTDATAFVQIGTTVTGGATTSIYTSTNQTIEVGSCGAANAVEYGGSTDFSLGKYYRAFAASLINGYNRMPSEIRTMAQSYGSAGVRGGGNRIVIYNASVGGVALSTHYADPQYKREIPLTPSAFVWIASTHNEVYAMSWVAYLTALDTMIAKIKERIKMPVITICTENPRYSPADAKSIESQKLRNVMLHAYAAKNNLIIADIYSAYGSDRNLVQSDGVHPTPAGSLIGAATVSESFGLL